MQLLCSSCERTLEITGEPPKFCAYCGQPFASAKMPSTVTVDPEAETLPPPEVRETTTPIPEKPPERVGGYRLLRVLGQGGMGTVYEAESESSSRHVALKLISPEFAQSKDAVLRFRQEGRLASAVVHPRCVFVVAADEEGGRPYIVMELMPGSTLKDLIDQKGPMKPAEAVTRVLDVIEGLQEAHRLGVVHRDVKPSNCFLDKEGRVKIGDFGLAKSLVRESNLTKTGSFLGTPLYSSPEQVKGEAVDEQSDVYSVAATLYYLLVGRAPHQGTDAMATLARIISDPAPPLRSVVPDVPPELDAIVLRGLDRDKKSRWQNLGDFRAALLPYVPGHMSIGNMGVRFAAYAIDYVVLALLSSGAASLFAAFLGLGTAHYRTVTLVAGLIPITMEFVYFALFEWMWGWSLGKRWLRLRVRTSDDVGKPGLGRALLRSFYFHVLLGWGQIVGTLIAYETAFVDERGTYRLPVDMTIISGLLRYIALALGIFGIVITMRARNGYRGLHEFLSGTRTVRLPRPRSQRVFVHKPFQPKQLQPDGIPHEVGGYTIHTAVRWTDQEKTLVGEDARIGRPVWIWLRPVMFPPLKDRLRDVNRSSRLRWVAGGTIENQRWDAFTAPNGAPLTEIIAREKKLNWTDARPILEQLISELSAALDDKSVPDIVRPDLIWINPTGRLQLLPVSLLDRETAEAPDEVVAAQPAQNEDRALSLLADVTVLLLEGKPRPEDQRCMPLRSPIPLHARQIVDRLAGGMRPYRSLDHLQHDLSETRERPTEVTRGLRFASLLMQAAFWFAAGFMFFLVVGFFIFLTFMAHGMDEKGRPRMEDTDLTMALIYAGYFWYPIWIIWCFALRGGVAFRLAGVALVDRDGQPASRWRCGWRAFLIWTPVVFVGQVMLYLLAYHDGALPDEWVWLPAAELALVGAYFVLALIFPRRNVQDVLSGTVLVPR